MEVAMAPRSTCSYSYGLVLGSPVRNKELGLMILTGPFQIEIYHGSMKNCPLPIISKELKEILKFY